mmetsp:Transcript_20983/g.40624  ORF Transcript_20983/g.40624 Transcript_20983/m.40624 type:complete len:329 (+) Transcript_20983:360-1346(+)
MLSSAEGYDEPHRLARLLSMSDASVEPLHRDVIFANITTGQPPLDLVCTRGVCDRRGEEDRGRVFSPRKGHLVVVDVDRPGRVGVGDRGTDRCDSPCDDVVGPDLEHRRVAHSPASLFPLDRSVALHQPRSNRGVQVPVRVARGVRASPEFVFSRPDRPPAVDLSLHAAVHPSPYRPDSKLHRVFFFGPGHVGDNEILVAGVMQHFDERLLHLGLEERAERPGNAHSGKVGVDGVFYRDVGVGNRCWRHHCRRCNRPNASEPRGDRGLLVRIMKRLDGRLLFLDPPLHFADLVPEMVHRRAVMAIVTTSLGFGLHLSALRRFAMRASS